MLSLKKRIELLENDIKSNPPAFTMTSDLPFAIFRYDPSDPNENEWKMRHEIQKLATRVENATGRKVHMLSLGKLFWRSILESEGLETLVELEKERGFKAAQKQVNVYLSDPDWRPLTTLLMEETMDLDPNKDIVFLTRASVFAPAAYRITSLLEQMHGQMKVPTVLFYPGTWGESLNYMGLRTNEQALGSYRVKIYGRD